MKRLLLRDGCLHSFCLPRGFSTAILLFDEKAKTRQKERGYLRAQEERVVGYDRIYEEVAYRLVDRFLKDITPRAFNTIVNLGWDGGHVEHQLHNMLSEHHRIKHWIQTDSSSMLLNFWNQQHRSNSMIAKSAILTHDQKGYLSLEPNSIDAILSNLQLHFVNDLPGLLLQAQQALRLEGVLLASLLGGQTLFELRSSLQSAEMEREGGLAPHISPFAGQR
jgi:NADH dehydrogenase [ubiquinone] 1 alpha subcomplex assembly factor 5